MKYIIISGLMAVGILILKSGGTSGDNPPSIKPPQKHQERNDFPDLPQEKPSRQPTPEIIDREVTREDLAYEEKVEDSLKSYDAFTKIADIESVSCELDKCKIIAEAKGEDNSSILMSVIKFSQEHPEYGQRIQKDDVADNPRSVSITLFKDKE